MIPLRVLITNNTLDRREGSELYAYDIALALRDRGHTPILYSTQLGGVAAELRSAAIPVIDDLELLAVAPDIIHGQHHVEAMTAMLHFFNTPAIYICHGFLPWEEAPPPSPRIQHFVAVDQVCRDRLVLESGIPPERVHVLLNFVDLDRFTPRPKLRARPQRALFLNNAATEQTSAPVREACARMNISLDIVGSNAGNATKHPEALLRGYDLVFAKGRTALEAMAVGAAVVLCNYPDSGPLVTSENFDRLRPLNFGIKTLRHPLNVDVLSREIEKYDAADAEAVSTRVRREAGRDAVVDRLIDLYRDAIAVHHTARIDPADEGRAAARYLRWLSPRLKDSTPVYEKNARLIEENARLRAERDVI